MVEGPWTHRIGEHEPRINKLHFTPKSERKSDQQPVKADALLWVSDAFRKICKKIYRYQVL